MDRDLPPSSRRPAPAQDRTGAASELPPKMPPAEARATEGRFTGPPESSGADPVLAEFDQVFADLRPRRNGEAASEGLTGSAGRGSPGATKSDAAALDELWGAPSGYLEEHLKATRLSLTNLEAEIARLDTTSKNLRSRVAAAESGLDSVSREYEFVRSHGWMPDEAAGTFSNRPPWDESSFDEGSPRPTTRSPARPSRATPTPAARLGTPPAPVYMGFTVDRYNRTVDALKARRVTLVVLTLLISAGIGTLLVAIVLFSPAVDPPLWIAALPLVWMVPIPFFLLSFRGTQRVLQRNHLNLPEEE